MFSFTHGDIKLYKCYQYTTITYLSPTITQNDTILHTTLYNTVTAKCIYLLTKTLSASSKAHGEHCQPPHTGKRQTLRQEICFPMGSHTPNESNKLDTNKAAFVVHSHSVSFICPNFMIHYGHNISMQEHDTILLSSLFKCFETLKK